MNAPQEKYAIRPFDVLLWAILIVVVFSGLDAAYRLSDPTTLEPSAALTRLATSLGLMQACVGVLVIEMIKKYLGSTHPPQTRRGARLRAAAHTVALLVVIPLAAVGVPIWLLAGRG